MPDLEPGDVIKAGTLVLLTSGEYSNYGVVGLFRAEVDVTVPGKKWFPTSRTEFADVQLLSTRLVEVPYTEVHGEE